MMRQTHRPTCPQGPEPGRALRRALRAVRAVLQRTLAAGLLLALGGAVLQTAILSVAQQRLQAATGDAARLLRRITIDSGSAALTGDAFKALVCARTGPLLDCPGLRVDVRSLTRFGETPFPSGAADDDGSDATFPGGRYDPGQAGDLVIVRTEHDWPVFGPLPGIGSPPPPGHPHVVSGMAVYRNGPAP